MSEPAKTEFLSYLESDLGPTRKAVFKGTILAFQAVSTSLSLRSKKLMPIEESKAKGQEIAEIILKQITDNLQDVSTFDANFVKLRLFLISDIICDSKNAPMPSVSVFVKVFQNELPLVFSKIGFLMLKPDIGKITK